MNTVNPVLSGHSKRRPKFGFQDPSLLNAGQKYCRMLQWEHSAILSTFIRLPFVIKSFVVSIFEWPIKTGFTVYTLCDYWTVTHNLLLLCSEFKQDTSQLPGFVDCVSAAIKVADHIPRALDLK